MLDARILVTGGGGFVGQHVLRELQNRGCRHVVAPRSAECDLRDLEAVRRLLAEARPDLIIHLAAVVGGIGANRAHPGRFFYDNAIMGIQLMEQARLHGVGKFVSVGTVCSYPHTVPVPFREEHLWEGYPEPTNAPYGLAKKMLLVQGQAYRAEYGFNAIHLLPTNLYGPGDSFDLDSGHVIPGIVRKCLEADDEVVLWGDGSPTREFLYVEDAARGIVLAAERYDGAEPVNLGSGQETSIRELAELIAAEVGFTGRLRWDTTRPNGQPRRRLEVTRARQFGFEAQVTLAEGLRRTIAWYRSQ